MNFMVTHALIYLQVSCAVVIGISVLAVILRNGLSRIAKYEPSYYYRVKKFAFAMSMDHESHFFCTTTVQIRWSSSEREPVLSFALQGEGRKLLHFMFTEKNYFYH